MYAFALCFVSKSIVIQIGCLQGANIFVLCFFISKMPMYSGLGNAVHIFNEVFVLVLVNTMFLFTEYVPDPVLRYDLGYKFLYICSFVVGVNLLVFAHNIVRLIYDAGKRKLLQRKAKKVHEQRLKKARDQFASSVTYQSQIDAQVAALIGR